MTEIPAITQEDLARWYEMKQQLATLRATEMMLRKRIFAHYFPEPDEGVNNFTLPDGYVLKGTQGIDRQIDEPTFLAMVNVLHDEYEIPNPEILIRRKPELVIKEYRKLTDKQMHGFDQCLIIKPESPSLEIVKPKK